MHWHYGTNNRAPRWTFTDPCKPEVRPDAREESASPAWLAAPAMNARVTTKVYIWRLDTGCVPTLYRKCHSHNTPGKRHNKTWIQTRCKLLLGEQVLTCTIFLSIKRVRLKWNCIVYDVWNAFYSSHEAPCPAWDLFPWLNTRVKVHVSVWKVRGYPERHSSYLSDSGDTFLRSHYLRFVLKIQYNGL